MVITIASPFILLEKALKKTGVASAIEEWYRRNKKRKTKLADIKRKRLVAKLKKELHCKDVKVSPAFWLGGNCMGVYSNGRIKVSSAANGISAVATAYHEDRHYQQENTNPDCFRSYIKAEDDYKEYLKQHVEKDARRYSYVKTMRYAKEEFGTIKFMLFATVYRLAAHPWNNINKDLR